MNTRSRSRAVASQVAPPVEDGTPASLGIEFTEDFHHNRFNRLKDREIKSTKWACPHILNQLGLRHDFNTLCNNVGLLEFVFQEAATYRRLTLEFLSTLMHTVGRYHNPEENQPGVDRISFRLMNREYDLTLDEWCHYFGFDNSTSANRFDDVLAAQDSAKVGPHVGVERVEVLRLHRLVHLAPVDIGFGARFLHHGSD